MWRAVFQHWARQPDVEALDEPLDAYFLAQEDLRTLFE